MNSDPRIIAALNEIGDDRPMTLEAVLQRSRNEGFRYSQAIGDAVSEKYSRFIDENNQQYLVDSEVSILRHFVEGKLIEYEKARARKAKPGKEVIKQQLVEIAAEELKVAIATVVSTCKIAAGIKQQLNGKLDFVMLNSLVTSVVQSVDQGLQFFGEDMEQGGVSPRVVADHISGLVSSAVAVAAPGSSPAGLIGNNAVVSTPDQVVLDMDATIPYEGPAESSTIDKPSTNGRIA